jgi:hypothetical protein
MAGFFLSRNQNIPRKAICNPTCRGKVKITKIKSKEKLLIVSNDKIYNNHYLNHNDLNLVFYNQNRHKTAS